MILPADLDAETGLLGSVIDEAGTGAELLDDSLFADPGARDLARHLTAMVAAKEPVSIDTVARRCGDSRLVSQAIQNAAPGRQTCLDRCREMRSLRQIQARAEADARAVERLTETARTRPIAADLRDLIDRGQRDLSLAAPETHADPCRAILRELTEKRPNFSKIAEIVGKDLLARGEFFHPAGGKNFRSSLYFARATKTLETVQSDPFKQTVSDRFGLNRASPAWKPAWAHVENLSIGPDSTPTDPEAFWASRPGAVYLSNGPGAIVRIQANGIDLCDNGTDGVLFPRGKTLAPWTPTAPIDPFETCSLFQGVSTTAGHGPLLAKLWALSLPTCPQNKPPIVMAGPIGSGKTRFIVGLMQLYGIDPAGRVLAVDDDRESDFWPVLEAGGLLIADNADTKVRWLPDALAQASTGLGRTQRKLYTDAELVAHRARSWVALTTARPEAFAGDPGLADRLLIVRMERRRGETRDADLSREIAEARNAGLSWIARTIAAALADTTEPPPGLNQRHPDFAQFAFRLGRALGRETEAVAALSAAETDKAAFCVENDTLGSGLLALLSETESFEGTAAELLDELRNRGHVENGAHLSAKGLGRRIEGLWPHLEKVFAVSRCTLRTGTRRYRLAVRGQNREPIDLL
jgi:hypothetical protein